MKRIEALVAEILDKITRRYILTDMKIPEEILALKDETMDLFVKAKHESDPEKLRQYERRLAEIRERAAARD